VSAAVVEGGRFVSRDELDERVDAVARYLLARAPEESVIGVTVDNRLESVELMLGVMRAGMTVLPLPGFLPWIARKALTKTARPALEVGLKQKHLDPAKPEQYAQALTSAPDTSSPDDGAMMFASGGTEGRPRLLLHTADRMMRYLEAVSLPELGFHDGARVLNCVPMSVGAGMIPAINTLNGAGTVILDQQQPDALRWEYTAVTSKATASVVNPVVARRLVDHKVFAHDIRFLMSSVDTLSTETQSQLLSAFPQASLINFYSSVETGLVSYKIIDEPTSSLGTPFPDVEVRMRGEDELGIGIVEVRGDSTAVGVVDETGLSALPDWVSPGDYGQLIDGEVHLVGRRSDKIIVSGFTVYASQVEAVALTVDGVTEAAAVGAPSRKRGHDIELFICGDATSAAVLDRCSRALPKHAVPVRVTRVDSLPTSPSGKVRKRDLL